MLAVLLFGGAIFLVSGTNARQQARFVSTGPTLNGLAFMQSATYHESLDNGTGSPQKADIHLEDDRPLIDWLRDNVQGSPVITEAVGPLYHWTGRISEYTGLPAVIGWDWHQIQQRTDYQDLVAQRRADTDRFYTDPSVSSAEQYLLKYNVAYVVVGTEERFHATDDQLAKFDRMPELTRVFTSGPYRIYRVDQSKLPAPATSTQS